MYELGGTWLWLRPAVVLGRGGRFCGGGRFCRGSSAGREEFCLGLLVPVWRLRYAGF